MAKFSAPFRLYLLKDPATGKRRQVIDAKEAKELAREIADRTGARERDILAPSRSWYVYTYAGRNRRGKRINTRQPTKYAAEKWLEDRQGKTVAPVARVTFGEATKEWLEEKDQDRKRPRSPRTMRAYRVHAKVWGDHFGDELVCDISEEMVERFFARRERGELGRGALVEEGEERPVPSNASLEKDRVLLSGFFKWASDGRRRYCDLNPVASIEKYRDDTDEPEVLTRKEIGRLLDACRSAYTRHVERKDWRPYKGKATHRPPEHLYGVVLVGVHALLRLGNILELRWENVDLERREIRIAGREMKGRAKVAIPMTPTLHAYFRSLDRGAPAAPVFGADLKSIRRAFRSAAIRAGRPGLTFHTLRKSSATVLLEEGVPLKTVQAMGGWKSATVLLKHYAAATETGRKKALRVLNGLG